MRKIVYKANEVDLTCAATLSEKWDEKHQKVDTEYLNIDCNVLGNAMGKNKLESDDLSSAWSAVHGRKYNNARISIPFSREFVSKNMGEIQKVTAIIASKCSGACAVVQKMMTEEQKKLGRETAMRTQAIREAKDILLNTAGVVDQDLFNEANRPIRGEVASKVNFEYGVSVSARRIKDTEGLNNKKQFKRKNILIGSSSEIAYVTTMDEKGLKKVPLMTTEMRDKAEEMVYKFALVVKEAIKPVAEDPTDEKMMAVIKAISEKMPGDSSVSTQVPSYTEEEISKMRDWTNQIIKNYRSLE